LGGESQKVELDVKDNVAIYLTCDQLRMLYSLNVIALSYSVNLAQNVH